MTAEVKLERRDNLALVTLDRPDSLNAAMPSGRYPAWAMLE